MDKIPYNPRVNSDDRTATRPLVAVLGWSLWVVFSFFLASMVIASMMLLLQHYKLLDIQNLGTVPAFIIDASVYVMMFIFVMWLPWRIWKKGKNKEVNFKSSLKFLRDNVGLQRWPRWVDLRFFFANLPVFYVLVIGFSILATYLLGSQTMSQEQEIGFKVTESAFELGIIFITLVIIAPLFEEMMMRGFLFGRLRKHLSLWPSAVIVSMLFALAHGQINVGIMTFVLSMFSCRMREKTGTIWASIFLHMTVNFIAFCIRFLGLGS